MRFCIHISILHPQQVYVAVWDKLLKKFLPFLLKTVEVHGNIDNVFVLYKESENLHLINFQFLIKMLTELVFRMIKSIKFVIPIINFLYDVYRSKNYIFLSFFFIHHLIHSDAVDYWFTICSLTTGQECIATTFIWIVY